MRCLLCHGALPSSSCQCQQHTLTGWIPERISTSSEDFSVAKDRVWQRMLNGQKLGDCLITASTSALADAQADQLGLVPTHAYAVLRVEQVGDRRLLQIKNPWYVWVVSP